MLHFCLARAALCVGLVLTPLLTGCANAPGSGANLVTVSPASEDGCCVDPGTFPPLLVALAEPFAEPIGRIVGAVSVREGYLTRAETVRARVEAQLKPLDILLTNHEGQLSSRIIPGYLTHAVTYLGTPAQLKALGVWSDPAFLPYQAALLAGRRFVDAERNGVRLTIAATVFDNDNVVVVRPTVLSRAQTAAAALRYARAVGGRFDFHFDLRTTDCVFCTELVYRSIPELRLPVSKFEGRPVVFADAVARMALAPGGRLSFVAYARGRATGMRLADRRELAADIAAAWRRPSPVTANVD
jgi:hypothetical protein